MPILLDTDTASTTYKEMSKLLPSRFRKRRGQKPQSSVESDNGSGIGMKREAAQLVAQMKDVLFEPRNPFDSQAKRSLRREIAFLGGLVFAFFAVFVVSSILAR